MSRIQVGYLKDDYLYERNIVGIVEGVDYVKVHNLYDLLVSAARSRIARRVNRVFKRRLITPEKLSDIGFTFRDPNVARRTVRNRTVLHFFNTVSFSHTPWVSTFETIIPRYSVALSCMPDLATLRRNRQVERAIRALSRDSCKKLIAISRCSLLMQQALLEQFPDYKNAVEEKLCVMHPPQKLIVHDYGEKRLPQHGPTRFMFVGASFFRKGGMEILRALANLRGKDRTSVELTVVSSLTIDNYATKETVEDVRNAKRIIEANSDWIHFYDHLSNKRVLELMRQSHVGLLPTYADTYGFAVLEFQATGCPVISTDVRALSEINDNQRGWLISIPKNRLREALYVTKEQRAHAGALIQAGLEKIVEEIVNDPSIISLKAQSSMDSIRMNHSPADHASKLALIYAAAVRRT